jgi:pimeloyl-ACP methyl ester carboxylesterase
VALVDWMAADAFDRMQDLAGIACPTLVLAGTQDRLTPEKYAQYLATNIRDAKLDVIYGGAHMCPAERPAEVARHVSDFLARVR